MKASVETGLAFNAFTLGADSCHPWLLAAKVAADGGGTNAIIELLDQYYSLVQPRSLHDWLDIPPQACTALRDAPVYAWMSLPWSITTPQEIAARVEATQLQENRRHGLDAGVTAGAKAFGPISSEKLRVEAERIAALVASIGRAGLQYKRRDYDARAIVLLTAGRWRWLSIGGAMHRVPVAAGLGLEHIPIRVTAVVRREEAEIWPQVASGIYDVRTAISVFDRLFAGHAPACAQPWMDWVRLHFGSMSAASASVEKPA